MRDPIAAAKGRASTSIPASLGKTQNESAPQAPEDRPAPGHDGEVSPDSWLRGANEDACDMPGFDHSGPSGSRYDKRKYHG